MDTHFLQEKEEKTEAQDFKQLPQRHTDRKSRARHQTLSLRHYHLCLAQSKVTQWSRKCKCVLSHSVTSSSLWPHGLQPTRLLCPWDSPAKNTGVGCHALVPGISTTQESNPGLPHCRWILYCLSHQESPENASAVLGRSVMFSSLQPHGLAAHQAPLSMGILQAKILEWVAMPSFQGSPQPRDQTQFPRIAGGFFFTA